MNLRMYSAEKDSLFFLVMYVIPVLVSISVVHKPEVTISTAEFLRPVPYPSSPLPFLSLPIPKNRKLDHELLSYIVLSSGLGGIALTATLYIQQENTKAEFCPAVYKVESTTMDAFHWLWKSSLCVKGSRIQCLPLPTLQNVAFSS
jgi:hypothetical protein